jgi:hypothetical protein
MPTFCRHNRFLDRCPICSRDAAERAGATAAGSTGRSVRSTPRRAGASGRERHGARQGVRVRREARAQDDGYRCELVPGLRASEDARRLADEIAFSCGRLALLQTDPPGMYRDVRSLGEEDLERATWACLLIAYLSPVEGDDPWVGIGAALEESWSAGEPEAQRARAEGPRIPDLDGIALGPRTSHDPSQGGETLRAYVQWVERGGSAQRPDAGAEPRMQAAALSGDPSWSPERRFERVFERLALPGFSRAGRYELLILLGHLGLYDVRADALHLGSARGLTADDPATLAAKRVFGIADPLLLERRAGALAEACAAPLEALDLALANWASERRATLGFPAMSDDEAAFELAEQALGL